VSAKFSLDDYIDVAERIVAFKDKYPDGSLQTIDWDVREVAGQSFVVYRAAAFRHADDVRPGHGIAWEPFPGQTPYTRNSELMNAETAAWGRAIVALGLTANRKLASRQEVAARRAEQQPKRVDVMPQVPPPEPELLATEEDVKHLRDAAKGLTIAQLKLAFTSCGIPVPSPFKPADAFTTVPRVKAGELALQLGSVER